VSGIIESIRGEFVRYKSLGEGAIAQLSDAELSAPPPGGGNSVATICWHIAGNLQSRFTDFLTTDGEKPWRKREEEFDDRRVTRPELLAKWDSGWSVVLSTLAGLTDADLPATVTIRQQPLLVSEALLRSLAHTASHVGQIVYAAKSMRGDAWTSLSIPRGQSAAYNQAPVKDRPPKG
jgi:uncharacterized damage-inducible protein DinB